MQVATTLTSSAILTGKVALIQRGTCTFHDKALNAQEAGAAAVIIFNEGQADLGRDGLLFGTLGTPDFDIPIIGVSFADGEELHNLLIAPNTVTVHIETDTTSEIRQAANVLADSKGGDPDRVVVQGSHLDSVPAGPGINDNGSGSAYNLESAIKLAEIGNQASEQSPLRVLGCRGGEPHRARRSTSTACRMRSSARFC